MSLNGCRIQAMSKEQKQIMEDHDQLFDNGSMESHAVAQQKPTKILCYGYIRNNFTKHIPFPLVMLCWKYLYDTIYYTFKRAPLSRFLACSVCKRMCYEGKGTTFSIQNIVWQNVWYPNGQTRARKGRVEFVLLLKSKPAHIRKIIVLVTFYGEKPEHEFRRVARFPTQKVNRICWSQFAMQLEQYKNHTSLNFACHVEILHLYDQFGICVYTKPIPWQKQCSFQYTLSSNKQKILCHKGAAHVFNVYSEAFGNDCWCLLFKRNLKFVDVYLKLLQLPVGRGTYTMEVKIKCQFIWFGDGVKQQEIEISKAMDYKHSALALSKTRLTPYKIAKHLTNTFVVRIAPM
eukprot:1070219_1